MPGIIEVKHIDSEEYSSSHSWFYGDAKIISGNPFTVLPLSFHAYNVIWYQTAPVAINDEIMFRKVLLKAGTYTLRVLGTPDTNRGITSVYVNGQYIGDMDWYAAVSGSNTIKSIFSIPFSGGDFVLSMKVTGKNGASSDYAIANTLVMVELE